MTPTQKHPEHICRFNDAPQECDCYSKGYDKGLHEMALKVDKHFVDFLKATESAWLREMIGEAAVKKALKGIVDAIKEIPEDSKDTKQRIIRIIEGYE